MALSITISAGLYDLPERHLLNISGLKTPYTTSPDFEKYDPDLYSNKLIILINTLYVRIKYLILKKNLTSFHYYERALSQFIIDIY